MESNSNKDNSLIYKDNITQNTEINSNEISDYTQSPTKSISKII